MSNETTVNEWYCQYCYGNQFEYATTEKGGNLIVCSGCGAAFGTIPSITIDNKRLSHPRIISISELLDVYKEESDND